MPAGRRARPARSARRASGAAGAPPRVPRRRPGCTRRPRPRGAPRRSSRRLRTRAPPGRPAGRRRPLVPPRRSPHGSPADRLRRRRHRPSGARVRRLGSRGTPAQPQGVALEPVPAGRRESERHRDAGRDRDPARQARARRPDAARPGARGRARRRRARPTRAGATRAAGARLPRRWCRARRARAGRGRRRPGARATTSANSTSRRAPERQHGVGGRRHEPGQPRGACDERAEATAVPRGRDHGQRHAARERVELGGQRGDQRAVRGVTGIGRREHGEPPRERERDEAAEQHDLAPEDAAPLGAAEPVRRERKQRQRGVEGDLDAERPGLSDAAR